MSAYSYCNVCNAPMGIASAREVVDGEQYRPAQHINEPNITKDELLVLLWDKVNKLSEVTEAQ